MKKAFRIIKITVRTLVLVLVALLLAYNIYTLVMRYACGVGIPTVFGYGVAPSSKRQHGARHRAGDFIIVHAEEEYAVGDVITFYDSARGEYVHPPYSSWSRRAAIRRRATRTTCRTILRYRRARSWAGWSPS